MLTLSNANAFSVLERVGDQELDAPFSSARSSSYRRGPSRLAGRRWQARDFVAKDLNSLKFRVVSYNVLAQCYAKQKHFSKCKPEHLRWDYRKRALLELLIELDADILCLQEIDNYDEFWSRELSKLGYIGTYKQRNSDAKIKMDGCATFFRSSSFTVVKEIGLELDHVPSCSGLEGAPDFATHNVALLTLVAPVADPKACFCVANIHLFWDPSYESLKIAQARAVVSAAQELATSVPQPAPIILAGDFNSMPSSEVYSYLTQDAGFCSAYAMCGVQPQRITDNTDKSKPAQSSTPTSATSLSIAKLILTKGLNPHSPEFRPLGMSDTGWSADLAPISQSLFADPKTGGGEPPFTNYRDIFHGTIDYIMVSRDDAGGGGASKRCASIQVLSSLGMISAVEAAKEGGGLPSSRHPSDHLPIAVELQLGWSP